MHRFWSDSGQLKCDSYAMSCLQTNKDIISYVSPLIIYLFPGDHKQATNIVSCLWYFQPLLCDGNKLTRELFVADIQLNGGGGVSSDRPLSAHKKFSARNRFPEKGINCHCRGRMKVVGWVIWATQFTSSWDLLARLRTPTTATQCHWKHEQEEIFKFEWRQYFIPRDLQSFIVICINERILAFHYASSNPFCTLLHFLAGCFSCVFPVSCDIKPQFNLQFSHLS